MPELLLDQKKCLSNINKMAGIAKRNHLTLRPHCKTHQSAQVAEWFREVDLTKITVSSFQMAAYFNAAGWEDILVAFPFDPGQLKNLEDLRSKCNISILLDHPDTFSFLKKINKQVNFYIDIDTGYGRTGIHSKNLDRISDLITLSGKNPRLNFSGFYCHAGHSYQAKDPDQQERIHLKAMGDLAVLKQTFSSHNPSVLYGDTPNCSKQRNFSAVDEITPGNFVFYDLIQRSLGSCSTEEIAVAMLCPVSGKYEKENKLLIHGGAVHFSKEILEIDGKKVYGETAVKDSSGWVPDESPSYLTGMSQEHGILKNSATLFKRTRIGDFLYILPPHSCLTANLMRYYRTLDGKIITTMNS